MSTPDTVSNSAASEEVHPQPLLVIRTEDLPAEVRAKVIARPTNTRVLGGERDDAIATLFDALPGIIAKRLQKITPPSFRLGEIELELALDVAVVGIDIGGTVRFTLKPDSAKERDPG